MLYKNLKFNRQYRPKEVADTIIIDNVTIFDATGADAYECGRILIKDGKLVKIGRMEAVDILPESYVIDAKGMTAIPGMIDSHTHLSFNGVFETYPIFFGESLAERLSRNAWITLKSGVTTAREMPGFAQSILKESIEKGDILGPRLLISTSPLTVKGGYFDYPFFGTAIKDVKKIARLIDKKLKSGCDFIKTVAPYSDALRKQKNITLNILSTIVEQARKSGITVAAHSMWVDGLETVINANVTSIEHCPSFVGGIIPDEIFIRAKDKGIFFVPTAEVARRNYLMLNYQEKILEENEYRQNMPQASMVKMLRMAEKAKKTSSKKPHVKAAFEALFASYQNEYELNFKKAIKFGVKIAAGTDSGTNYVPHGILAKELALYVKLGMSPQQAILSATKVASQLLGLEKDIGTLEPDKRADLVLVKGNPLKNIADLQNIKMVIKGGAIVVQ